MIRGHRLLKSSQLIKFYLEKAISVAFSLRSSKESENVQSNAATYTKLSRESKNSCMRLPQEQD